MLTHIAERRGAGSQTNYTPTMLKYSVGQLVYFEGAVRLPYSTGGIRNRQLGTNRERQQTALSNQECGSMASPIATKAKVKSVPERETGLARD